MVVEVGVGVEAGLGLGLRLGQEDDMSLISCFLFFFPSHALSSLFFSLSLLQ